MRSSSRNTVCGKTNVYAAKRDEHISYTILRGSSFAQFRYFAKIYYQKSTLNIPGYGKCVQLMNCRSKSLSPLYYLSQYHVRSHHYRYHSNVKMQEYLCSQAILNKLMPRYFYRGYSSFRETNPMRRNYCNILYDLPPKS